MNYLLDTNVVSEFASTAPQQKVIDWFQAHQDDALYLSVITIGEIQQGIAWLSPSKKRKQLTTWLNEVLLVQYSDWIISIDNAIMIQWGSLTGRLRVTLTWQPTILPWVPMDGSRAKFMPATSASAAI